VKSYRAQRRRQSTLQRFSALVAGSRAMLAEVARQGVTEARLHFVPYFVPQVEVVASAAPPPPTAPDPSTVGLLFVGRADHLKGGSVLLDALPRVAERLGRGVRLEIAGDGPDLPEWRSRAGTIERASSGRIQVVLHGWLGDDGLEAARRRSVVLVVPSIWPEPFGLVGPEAGVHGLPAAAFDVGGISEWLTDGVNGHLARGDGPLRADALADAIVRCVADPAHWQHLREGARRLAGRFRLAAHLTGLEATFASALASHSASRAER
jgi:glycosyltransferase involved in cell wall biosynthesis